MNTVLNDISYGSHIRQKADIYIPQKIKSDSGIILFIHGGGWSQGDKSAHHTDCQHFCELGYICATMNYRFVSEEISVFDELDDITSALKAIKAKCTEFGFDIKRLILSGGSAGGHLSLLYAYTRKDESPVTPVAACVYCPPVNCTAIDFLQGISEEFDEWKYSLLSNCCGFKITKETFLNKAEQEALSKISPEEYILADCVPTAVFHGRHDDLVPIEHTHKFIGLLKSVKVKNDLLIFENSGHLLDKDPETDKQAKEIIKDYCETYL